MALVCTCDECGTPFATSKAPFTLGWRDQAGNLHLRDLCSMRCAAAYAIKRLPPHPVPGVGGPIEPPTRNDIDMALVVLKLPPMPTTSG